MSDFRRGSDIPEVRGGPPGPFAVHIQGAEIDVNPGAGLSDTVITPLSLGWHGTRFDATAGYTIFVPTRRYTDGANNNTGLGMWGMNSRWARPFTCGSRRHAVRETCAGAL